MAVLKRSSRRLLSFSPRDGRRDVAAVIGEDDLDEARRDDRVREFAQEARAAYDRAARDGRIDA